MKPEIDVLDVKTPLGILRLHGSEKGLKQIEWANKIRFLHTRLAILKAARCEIKEYFQRHRTCFGIPLDPDGSPFWKKVWKACAGIPFGKTLTYGELARKVGSPGAARAVGSAVASNPIPIVVPCHRVLASDGKLGGYSGRGGIRTKQYLLKLEGAA